MIQLFTRHGDRTPIFTYPYPVVNDAVWNCELNEVQNFAYGSAPTTNVDRLFRKVYMRNRYSSFVFSFVFFFFADFFLTEKCFLEIALWGNSQTKEQNNIEIWEDI